MNTRTNRSQKGFTLIELLVVVLILGILTAVALPSYLGSVQTSRQSAADSNARAIATAVQAKAVKSGSYDTTLSTYATDLGGAVPANPCGGSYTIASPTSSTATVVADSGTNCGTWTPKTFSLSL